MQKEGPSETLLAVISVGVAVLGLFLAWLLYVRAPQLPQQIAQGLGGFYEAVVHKYYVDELYGALFCQASDRRLNPNSVARRRSGSD